MYSLGLLRNNPSLQRRVVQAGQTQQGMPRCMPEFFHKANQLRGDRYLVMCDIYGQGMDMLFGLQNPGDSIITLQSVFMKHQGKEITWFRVPVPVMVIHVP